MSANEPARTIGVIGGIGPESTVEYYRALIAAFHEYQPGGSPSIVINSIDLQKMLGFVEAADLAGLADYLAAELQKLATAGAVLGLLAANTPHIVFDELRRRSVLPLVSIVEAARDAAQALGLRKAALFGTRFTMQGGFYAATFSQSSVAMALPEPHEQTYIHDIYVNELLNGTFSPQARIGVLNIARRMKERHGIDSVILGGTELPLLLPEETYDDIRFLNTTHMHARRAMAQLMS